MVSDKLIEKAIKIVSPYDRASASLLQRRLSIGYQDADEIMKVLESRGIVGPANGAYPREVIKKKQKIILDIKLIPGLIIALIFGSILSLVYILIFPR
jgi:hypothetical protein